MLVVVSLTAAILVAVPLGILATRWPRLGQAVLALAGLIQTIPSLALLVFLIPLFGLGPLPAIVAIRPLASIRRILLAVSKKCTTFSGDTAETTV